MSVKVGSPAHPTLFPRKQPLAFLRTVPATAHGGTLFCLKNAIAAVLLRVCAFNS